MKARHKMTPEERKEADYWFELRHEKDPEARFRMMMRHAGRQCEKILENGERCRNKHGEDGISIRGKIILTPKLGPKPILECQKCGFQEIAEQMERSVVGRKTRPKKKEGQVEMFA